MTPFSTAVSSQRFSTFRVHMNPWSLTACVHFSIFIASRSSVVGHRRPSALGLLPFLQGLGFPMVLSVILMSHVSCPSWNLHTIFPVQRIALSIWFTSTVKPNLLVGQRKQSEKKPEPCQDCHYITNSIWWIYYIFSFLLPLQCLDKFDRNINTVLFSNQCRFCEWSLSEVFCSLCYTRYGSSAVSL